MRRLCVSHDAALSDLMERQAPRLFGRGDLATHLAPDSSGSIT